MSMGHNEFEKLELLNDQSAAGVNLDLGNVDLAVRSISASLGLGVESPPAYTQTFSTADRTIANATVGADLGAFTDPPSAAEMAALRTFVNALKADGADLRQGLTAVIDDLQAAKIVS